MLMLAAQCTQNILRYTRYSIVQKISNKQSAKVICRLDRLRIAAHSTARAKKPYEQWKTYRSPMHLIT